MRQRNIGLWDLQESDCKLVMVNYKGSQGSKEDVVKWGRDYRLSRLPTLNGASRRLREEITGGLGKA